MAVTKKSFVNNPLKPNRLCSAAVHEDNVLSTSASTRNSSNSNNKKAKMTMTMMIFCSTLFLLFLFLFLSRVDARCRSCSLREDSIHQALKEIAANVQPVLPSWLLAFLLLVPFFAWISFTGCLAAFWNCLVRLDKNNYPKCRWILEVVSWLDDKFSWFRPENLDDDARKANKDLRATNTAQASVIRAQASLIAAVEKERDALRETLRLTEQRLLAAVQRYETAEEAIMETRKKFGKALWLGSRRRTPRGPASSRRKTQATRREGKLRTINLAMENARNPWRGNYV